MTKVDYIILITGFLIGVLGLYRLHGTPIFGFTLLMFGVALCLAFIRVGVDLFDKAAERVRDT